MTYREQEAQERAPVAHGRGIVRDIRIGWLMALFLGVQTILEYALALVLDKNFPIMVVINVTEALAILVFFMHIPRLWRGREE